MRLRTAALLALLSIAPLAQAHDPTPPRRSLAVSGQGEVSVKPDSARLALAVDAFSAEVKPAEAQVNKVVRDFLVEARALGAKDEHLSTTALTISPEYVWDEKSRQNRLTGYRARRDIEVQVKNLDQLGEFLMRATKVGINQVSPPALESSKAGEHQRAALVKATDDAKAKAKLLADTLGVKLGAIFALNATESQDRPPYPMAKGRVMAMAAPESGNDAMGIATGEIRFAANVQADFDLVAP